MYIIAKGIATGGIYSRNPAHNPAASRLFIPPGAGYDIFIPLKTPQAEDRP